MKCAELAPARVVSEGRCWRNPGPHAQSLDFWAKVRYTRDPDAPALFGSALLFFIRASEKSWRQPDLDGTHER